jgi:formylglycine-generating enzyme required for sulfatase activity/Flp pilus assembly protein TadD/tRNA A-37 threonylcarbamoyl transferase component Bud32
MGAVYLAEQIAVGNRPVALKVLSRKLLDDPDFLQRFQNEAASTGRIRHPNVVTIYESGQADDGTPYIAMEFLEGQSLRQALTRRGALPVPEVAEILQQAARGLNAAHKLGIIHRDLKPDNIFLTYPDDDTVAPVSPPASRVSPPANVQVKIVDFGIAKLRESGAHTQTGMVLGTPAYMSFEQASGLRSDELDARSDVYSLGVVVYEMLTGRTPFHSDTPVGYLRMHMQEDPPPFRAVKPDLPALPRLESVVMRALTKDRNQRYGSVLEFARELTSAAQPWPAAQSPVPILPTQIVPPALPKPRHLPAVTGSSSRVKFVVLGLVLLAIIAAGILHFFERAVKPHPSAMTGPAKVNPKDGLKYVWIPPGSFQMGCSPGDTECLDDEKPAHQVTIGKGFWLGQTEVTVGAYKRFAGGTGRGMPETQTSNPGWSNEQMPIVNVIWDDAEAYCAWAGGRLPTEAEWEYAARGGSTQARYGSLDEVAWYSENNGRQMHPVGQKRPNGFWLYDVLGNALEWVNDWYDENYYQSSPSQDPSGPMSGTKHVLRGGDWSGGPWFVRVSDRGRGVPGNRDVSSGVRCVVEMFPPSAPQKEIPLRGVSAPAIGTLRENPKDGLKYVWIPPGSFQMGCSPGDSECDGSEKPSNQVTIAGGFWLGQTEATVGAYKRFVGQTGNVMPAAPPDLNRGWGNDQMPMVNVSWNDAQAYCAWAGSRLPTEAEWEYAARGGNTQARYGLIDEVAWFGKNSGGQTHPVGEKRPNVFGLYDMLGNVWEWVNDWYDKTQDTSGPLSGTLRVVRGGSCFSYPSSVRVSARSGSLPSERKDDGGFRCVWDIAGQKDAQNQQPPEPAPQPPDTKAQLAEKHVLKGDALFSKADLKGAIAEYRTAMRLKPDVANARGLRGLELEYDGNIDGAIAEYREMVRLGPNDPRAHFGLGVNLGLKGDWGGEITEEREAIRLRPDYADAHFNLGLALGEKGDLDGAISEFRMAIRLKADYAMAHNALGWALEQKGELQPALEEYRQAYELAPKNPTVRGDYEKLVKRMNPQP